MSIEDTKRLDWAEQHPLEFLEKVLGKCPDGSDGLKVSAPLTGKTLDSGALEIGKPHWNMRLAIDEARSKT